MLFLYLLVRHNVVNLSLQVLLLVRIQRRRRIGAIVYILVLHLKRGHFVWYLDLVVLD